MPRFEFEVVEDYSYTEIGHFAQPDVDHGGYLRFPFRREVDGINRVAVFCQSTRPISVRVDRNQKRLEVVYPFSAYPAFSRIHHEIRRDNGIVYGVWEMDASGSVIRFALQHERGDTLTKATFPSEPWPV